MGSVQIRFFQDVIVNCPSYTVLPAAALCQKVTYTHPAMWDAAVELTDRAIKKGGLAHSHLSAHAQGTGAASYLGNHTPEFLV